MVEESHREWGAVFRKYRMAIHQSVEMTSVLSHVRSYEIERFEEEGWLPTGGVRGVERIIKTVGLVLVIDYELDDLVPTTQRVGDRVFTTEEDQALAQFLVDRAYLAGRAGRIQPDDALRYPRGRYGRRWPAGR